MMFAGGWLPAGWPMISVLWASPCLSLALGCVRSQDQPLVLAARQRSGRCVVTFVGGFIGKTGHVQVTILRAAVLAPTTWKAALGQRLHPDCGHVLPPGHWHARGCLERQGLVDMPRTTLHSSNLAPGSTVIALLAAHAPLHRAFALGPALDVEHRGVSSRAERLAVLLRRIFEHPLRPGAFCARGMSQLSPEMHAVIHDFVALVTMHWAGTECRASGTWAFAPN